MFLFASRRDGAFFIAILIGFSFVSLAAVNAAWVQASSGKGSVRPTRDELVRADWLVGWSKMDRYFFWNLGGSKPASLVLSLGLRNGSA